MKMRVMMITMLLAGALAAPGSAGEVRGTGAQVDANGRSICKFSGLNDGDPPLGRVQSFGQEVVRGAVDPTQFDPDDLFSEFPGWFCNPNNFDARIILPR